MWRNFLLLVSIICFLKYSSILSCMTILALLLSSVWIMKLGRLLSPPLNFLLQFKFLFKVFLLKLYLYFHSYPVLISKRRIFWHLWRSSPSYRITTVRSLNEGICPIATISPKGFIANYIALIIQLYSPNIITTCTFGVGSPGYCIVAIGGLDEGIYLIKITSTERFIPFQ